VSQYRPANIYAYVADNPLKDFAGPGALGWLTVRVRRPDGLHYAAENSEVPPDREMSDCSALAELFAQL